MKSLCTIAIEWMDKDLDEINSRGDLMEFLDIYAESPLEDENDGNFTKQRSHYKHTIKSLLV